MLLLANTLDDHGAVRLLLFISDPVPVLITFHLSIDYAKYVEIHARSGKSHIPGRVIFKNTVVTAPFNTALWSEWSTSTPNTDHVFFADYNTSGGGVNGASRPSFATVLSASQAAAYTISSAVGSDYTSWVDTSYVV